MCSPFDVTGPSPPSHSVIILETELYCSIKNTKTRQNQKKFSPEVLEEKNRGHKHFKKMI